MSSADLRASDADRDRAAELLRGHAADGRLTVEELDERCERALAAVTRGQLDALFADLPRARHPAPRVDPPVRPAHAAPRMPGSAAFGFSWRAAGTREHALSLLLEKVAPPLHASGYALVDRTSHRLTFETTRRPLWTIVPAVLLFPFGLLALLYRQHEVITIELDEQDGEIVVVASGVAPLSVRKGFALLSE